MLFRSDGETSTEENPVHTYKVRGKYRVVLTVTSENGCTDKDVFEINNYLKLIADAGANKEICLGETIRLNGSAKDGLPEYEYLWNPENSLDSPDISNPIATPDSTTMYYLTVTDSIGCISTDSVLVTVKPLPKVVVQDNIFICAGDSIEIGGDAFGAPGPFQFEWTPSTGLSDTKISNPIAKPVVTTVYTVKITSSNGCSAENKFKVEVKPIPNAEAGEDVIICYGDSVLIGDFASCGVEPFSYSWLPRNGLSDPNSARTLAYPLSTTKYVLKVTDAINRVAYDTIEVFVNPFLTLDAGENIEICNGTEAHLISTASGGTPLYNYRWYDESGNLIGDVQPLTVEPSLTTKFFVIVTDANGCTSTDSMTIIVNPKPSIDAGKDTMLCAGSSYQIGNEASRGTPPYTYKWDPPTYLSSTIDAKPIATAIKTTLYAVTVTDSKGCISTDSILIEINPIPTAIAGDDMTICAGDTIKIGGEAFCGLEPYQYEWTPNTNIIYHNIAEPLVFPKTTTTYIVKVTDALNRFDYDTVVVNVNPLPNLAGTPDVAICLGDSAIIGSNGISGTPPYSYKWYSSELISNPESEKIIVSPQKLSLYIQQVTDANGCSNYDSIWVRVNNPPKVKIIGNTTTCVGKSIQLSVDIQGGSPDYQYYWSPSDYLDDFNSSSPKATPMRNITYKVVVIDANGCKDSAFHSIVISEISSLLRVPVIHTNPKQKNLRIPIYLDDEKNITQCLPDSLYIRMQWDATLYNPTGVSMGRFSKTLVPDCLWEVDIVVPTMNHLAKIGRASCRERV